jgi:hypothetical protein
MHLAAGAVRQVHNLVRRGSFGVIRVIFDAPAGWPMAEMGHEQRICGVRAMSAPHPTAIKSPRRTK